MCGIAGILDFQRQPVARSAIAAMVHSLQHRGPDATGVYHAEGIGLGHARLSVIDISNGAQPMQSSDHPVVLVFNGTLYNYIELRSDLQQRGYLFRTHSDTEVVLNMYLEYGDKCLNRFNGEWAFAVWDGRSRQLLLARDRFGAKPLYYAKTAKLLLFASEIKALFATAELEPKLDLRGLHEAFLFWAPRAPRTSFAGIKEVVPGTVVTVCGNNLVEKVYWTYEFSRIDEGLSEAACLEELRERLTASVALRLRADTNVGAYLSGGLDSAVLAALASHFSAARLHTYSISFPDSPKDESHWQRQVSNYLDTEHHELQCREADIVTAFPAMVRHAEQPLLRTGPIPMFLLSALVRKHHDKVVLTGEGADETFGGYDLFKEIKIRKFVGRAPDSRWRSLLYKNLYSDESSLHKQPQAFLSTYFRTQSIGDHARLMSHLTRWQTNIALFGLFSKEVRAGLPGICDELLTEWESELPAGYETWGDFERAQYLEAVGILPGYLLSSQGDRAAMAHSVETRLPYLDPLLVDFACKLPVRLKMPALREKALLRSLGSRILPGSIVSRRKFPYQAPTARCLLSTSMGPGAEYLQQLLTPERLEQDGIFDSLAVQRLVTKVRARDDVSQRDSMAVMGVLSTQCLIDVFMRSSSNGCGHGYH